MKIRLIILMSIAFLWAVPGNLTEALRSIENQYGVRITFSPSITDSVSVSGVGEGSTAAEVLESTIKGTGFSYRQLSPKFFLVHRKDAQKAPEQKPGEVKPQQKPAPAVEPVVEEAPVERPASLPQIAREMPLDEVSAPQNELPYETRVEPYVQNGKDYGYLPKLALKTNLLSDAFGNANLGVEAGVAPRWSVELTGDYNAWQAGENDKSKHLIAQPEVRYWFCQRFDGAFVGAHAHGGIYNAGGRMLWGLATLDYRYQGWLAGAGVSAGYQWMLGKRFSLEAVLGLGYTYIYYDRYPCVNCGKLIDSGHKNYVGPTKAAVTITYNIK